MLLCSFTPVELPAGPRCELASLLSPGYAGASPNASLSGHCRLAALRSVHVHHIARQSNLNADDAKRQVHCHAHPSCQAQHVVTPAVKALLQLHKSSQPTWLLLLVGCATESRQPGVQPGQHHVHLRADLRGQVPCGHAPLPCARSHGRSDLLLPYCAHPFTAGQTVPSAAHFSSSTARIFLHWATPHAPWIIASRPPSTDTTIMPHRAS
jgi:hypothetical protein